MLNTHKNNLQPFRPQFIVITLLITITIKSYKLLLNMGEKMIRKIIFNYARVISLLTDGNFFYSSSFNSVVEVYFGLWFKDLFESFYTSLASNNFSLDKKDNIPVLDGPVA